MTQLKDIQATELDILLRTIHILDKNNIRYYLAYGTCLGAVRHQGFIPWDDDIDICLLRNEYERARQILIKELPNGYTYCDRFTEDEYPYNFGKVRKNETAFVHAGDAHLNIHHGIYIDLFPLDCSAADIAEFHKHYRKIWIVKQLIDLKCMSYGKYGKFRPLWHLPLIWFSHTFFSKRKLQDNLDVLIQKYNRPSDCENTLQWICSYLGDYSERACSKREWFGKGKSVVFEGVKCRIPLNAEEYLGHMYGDYMKLPPEEKRVSHHDAVYISTTRAYFAKKKYQ